MAISLSRRKARPALVCALEKLCRQCVALRRGDAVPMRDTFLRLLPPRETRPRRSVQFILLGEPFGVRMWNDTPRSDSRTGMPRSNLLRTSSWLIGDECIA